MCRAGDDGPDFFSERKVTARKIHSCGECGRGIHPGETYKSMFSVQDGAVHTHKMCAHCGVGAAWLVKNCDGYVFGEVADDLREHAEDYPGVSGPLLAITKGMRGYWQAGGREVIGEGPYAKLGPLKLLPIPDLPPLINVEKHA